MSAPMNKARKGPVKDDWRTPPELAARLHEKWGFTLDLATDGTDGICGIKGLTGPHRPKPIYSQQPICYCGLCDEAENEAIFCNPPYSDLRPWIIRFDFLAAFQDCLVVALLPVSPTSQKWWKPLTETVHELRFTAQRIRFVAPATGQPGPAPTGSNVIAIWKPGVLPPKDGPKVIWNYNPLEGARNAIT